MGRNKSDVTINSDPALLDLEKVHTMLKDAFWSPNITINEIQKGIDNSALVVGAYEKDIGQIGFLRVISDKTRFAYILDVIVDERVRRQGIGRRMVKFALEHKELCDVYQWLLVTKDAHGVYGKVGFKPLEKPESWMMIRKDRPDRERFKY